MLAYLCIYPSVYVFLTWASPACSVPPGPVNSSSLLVQMWSRKSNIIFWFSSAPMKRFHLSVFTRRIQKACSRRKSTLSSDNTTPALRECSWGTRTPLALPLPKPLMVLLLLGGSAMETQLVLGIGKPEKRSSQSVIKGTNSPQSFLSRSEAINWAKRNTDELLLSSQPHVSSLSLSLLQLSGRSPGKTDTLLDGQVNLSLWQHNVTSLSSAGAGCGLWGL